MDKQQLAISKIKAGSNLFLSGGAGRGKSWVINQILDKHTVLCAPTGIAALNIKGVTCHSVFGLPLGLPNAEDMHKISRKMQDLFNNNSPVRRIIIDEIGTLRIDMLQTIDLKLKNLRGNNLPFGGLQVVVVGDFYQLEPVVGFNEYDVFYERHKSPFCFDSYLWNFETVILDKAYRQENKRQVKLLDSIRMKDKYYKLALDTISKECKPYTDANDSMHLCCFRDDAKKYNDKFYNALTSKEYSYKCKIDGKKLDKWEESVVPHNLTLKKDAKVMFKANDVGGRYVNGEMGRVVSLDEYTIRVKKDRTGEIVEVDEYTWEKFEYMNFGDGLEKEPVSTFTQFPLQLGWAATGHSSQGCTLDDVVIDVGRGCFAHGQLYMMISRVRDLTNMSIAGNIAYSDIICDKRVKEFYKRIDQ